MYLSNAAKFSFSCTMLFFFSFLLFQISAEQKVKFVGRQISHLWSIDENHTKRYRGTVLSGIRGCDGDETALYEVKYDDGDEIYELENL